MKLLSGIQRGMHQRFLIGATDDDKEMTDGACDFHSRARVTRKPKTMKNETPRQRATGTRGTMPIARYG